jgi:hypothetical protein
LTFGFPEVEKSGVQRLDGELGAMHFRLRQGLQEIGNLPG